MSENNIKKVPEIYFSQDVTSEDQIAFEEYISKFEYKDSPLQFIDFDNKIEELWQIICIYFAERLGIDISNRLLPRSKIHFMDPPLFSETKIQLNIPSDLRRAFYSNNVYHIFIRTTDKDGNFRTEGSLLRSLCHELIHSLSFKFFDLKRLQNKNQFILVKDGFHDPQNNEFNYLKEALAEVSVFLINQNYIKQNDLLAKSFEIGIKSETSGYTENVIILDSILLKSVEKNIETYNNLLNNLYSDYIHGTHVGLDKIKLIMGSEQFEIFKNLASERRNWDKINDLAKTLELNTFLKLTEGIEKIENYEYIKNL
jgi:hypothetical protein